MDAFFYEFGRACFIGFCIALAGGLFAFGKALVRKLFDIE